MYVYVIDRGEILVYLTVLLAIFLSLATSRVSLFHMMIWLIAVTYARYHMPYLIEPIALFSRVAVCMCVCECICVCVYALFIYTLNELCVRLFFCFSLFFLCCRHLHYNFIYKLNYAINYHGCLFLLLLSLCLSLTISFPFAFN